MEYWLQGNVVGTMMSFRAAVQGGPFAISAELALQRESSAADVAAQADLFRDRVDGMQVADNPLAWVHMSALSAASLLLLNGIDPIPILTCRDRNRIGLQSDLLGLRAIGVTSLMLMRGRRVGKNHALHASTVFDVTGRELITMARDLNEDKTLGPGEPFFIGTGAKAYRARKHWAGESLLEKAEAGAQFMQTQLCFNLDLLRHWMERLVAAQVTWRYSVIVSVTPLPSAETARWVKENLLDSKIPDEVIRRLEQAADPEAEGVAICAETMQQIKEVPGISGVNILSTGSPDLAAAAIDASGLRLKSHHAPL